MKKFKYFSKAIFGFCQAEKDPDAFVELVNWPLS